MTPTSSLKTTDRPRIGAHVKAAGGLHYAIANAVRIGAECIQIFGASPRQWQASMPKSEAIAAYKNALRASSVGPVFLHAAYVPNLAAPDKASCEKSVKNLAAHLAIAEAIGAKGLIFHIGSSKGTPPKEAIARVAEGMKKVLAAVPGKAFLVMENASGGGSKLGATVPELGSLMRLTKSPRVKICIDTAHAFEAGMLEFSPGGIKKFCNEMEKEVGLKNIAALHVNDSKTPARSYHDRHENIGEGFIGLTGFKNLAREKKLRHAAWILEVPGFDNEGPDKRNIDTLKSCFHLMRR